MASGANHFLILSIGTRVVADVEIRGSDGRPVHPRGAVGTVVLSPADHLHSYRVRFHDGFEASLRRSEMSVLSAFMDAGSGTAGVARNEIDLFNCVIYCCVVGSRAYGLDDDASDTDRRGIYLPPADQHWSLGGVPEQIDDERSDEVYWEIQKFLTLALKANPNVLECLYTPIVERSSPLADELREMRSGFLSKLVYQTYNGYVTSQFKKLQADLRNKGAVKWKHIMHLLRLLLSGIAVLRTGEVPVRVEDGYRDRLLSIKRGEVPFEELDAWRLTLHQQFQAAYQETALPDRPDYERANALLVKARRSVV